MPNFERFGQKMKSPGRTVDRVQRTEYRVQSTGYRVQSTEYRVQGTEYRVRITMTIAYDLRSKLKMVKLAFFSKFRTHDLEVLSPNYEKAHLLIIGNIAAKFEEATSCSYSNML